jgi:hypothetical protein
LTLSADPNAPPGVTLSGNMLSIPWGSTVGSFLVTYPATANPAAAAVQFWPNAWWIWGGNAPVQYYGDLSEPCCERADLCGLPLAQVSQEPCHG